MIYSKKRKTILLILIISLNILFYSCINKKNDSGVSQSRLDDNNKIPIYNFESLERLLYTQNKNIHIINFWAMWCAPCVKELPIIQEYEKNNPNVEVILVSLDFPEDIETKLMPFLNDKGITSKVVLLDDPDANSWIDKVNPNWSGAIPYTIIFNNEKRSFHERAFSSLIDLETEINSTFNN
ncbi:thioredoxin [Pseudalgibacter alginicilyticus]|uniref:Thioredoxin n=1 Tax=Pseudalgibacter alginicilyticus TaxID=1736674 RepID=A0A0P0CKM4_9FLAO|nr:TlpA disulfide reductase family protein [Pseudalgibacter alginicilyticus]ALJ06827.1 thioredoxin [Pseudalgibacter alginicilyticus]